MTSMGKIKGITVTLHVRMQNGVDGFGVPIMVDSTVDVDNVLVSPVSSEDSNEDFALYGKRSVYELAIPKGDTHVWEDTDVEFFGQKFHTFGYATQGIEENIPLAWNKKIKVEVYG